MVYLKRSIEPLLIQYVDIFPVVYVMGPRQSGKSTLLKHCLMDNYRYVTFDDDETRQFFLDDPKAFMDLYDDHVIFDEAQKAPEIFNAIKVAVDQDRQCYGKFILTGSANFLLMDKIKETLAGRIGVLTLLPLQYAEIPKKIHDDAIVSGSYPEIVTRDYKHTREWYSSYLSTYIERDVKLIRDIGDLRSFRQFIQLIAANASQQLNLSTYSKELGVAVNTIKKWVSVLEISFIIFLLPPYYNNLGKRIIKSPKIYFYDSGLLAYLTGVRDQESFEKGPMGGALFENYIVTELLKSELNFNKDSQLYYYRTSDGCEVDLIIDRKSHCELIEIKKSMTFRPLMLKPMQSIRKEADRMYLVYRGDTKKLPNRATVINYHQLLEKAITIDEL